MHIPSEPEILYFGTSVILISTCNEDGSFNIAPISNGLRLLCLRMKNRLAAPRFWVFYIREDGQDISVHWWFLFAISALPVVPVLYLEMLKYFCCFVPVDQNRWMKNIRLLTGPLWFFEAKGNGVSLSFFWHLKVFEDMKWNQPCLWDCLLSQVPWPFCVRSSFLVYPGAGLYIFSSGFLL